MLRDAPYWARECGFATSTSTATNELRSFLDDPGISRIKMIWDTPGGDVSGTEEFAAAIEAANKVKLVSSWVTGACCSAGIYCASQADSIIAEPSAIIGSIGAYSVLEDLSQLYTDMGVDVSIVRSAPAKGGAYGAPITPEHRTNVEEYIQAVHSQFCAAIKRGRGFTDAQVKAVATGEFWLAAKALEKGLIDGIGLEARSERLVRAPKSFMGHAPTKSARMAATTKGNAMKYRHIFQLLLADTTPFVEGAEETVGQHVQALMGEDALLSDERLAPGFPTVPEDSEEGASEALPAPLRARLAAAEARARAAEARLAETSAKATRDRYLAEAAGFKVVGKTSAQLATELETADKSGLGATLRSALQQASDAAAGHPAFRVHGQPSQGAAASEPTDRDSAQRKLDELANARVAQTKKDYHVAYLEVCRENPSIYALAR